MVNQGIGNFLRGSIVADRGEDVFVAQNSVDSIGADQDKVAFAHGSEDVVGLRALAITQPLLSSVHNRLWEAATMGTYARACVHVSQ